MIGLVTITRDAMETLPGTVASVAPFRDSVKHVFVDGSSSDGTAEYLRGYCRNSPRAIFHQQVSEGLYQALNEGIMHLLDDPDVTHLGVLHSDDLLVAEGFGRYLDAIKSGSANVFFANIQFHDQSGKIVRTWCATPYSWFRLRTGWMPPHTSVIVKRSIYERCGLYDISCGTAADYDWLIRMFMRPDVASQHVDETVLSMRVGGASGRSLRARLAANRMDGRAWSSSNVFQRAVIRVCKPARKITQYKLT